MFTMQGGAEATLVQRSLLQSENERVRLAAANALDRKRQKDVAREDRAGHAPADPLPPEVVQFITLLKGLSHDQLQKFIADLLARSVPEVGGGGAGGPAAPGPPQPG